jgi:hypothetical protein
VWWFLLMIAGFLAILLALALADAGGPTRLGAVAIALCLSVGGAVCFGYGTYRLGVGFSVVRLALAAKGGAFGDPERGRRRVADREEVEASRRLRRRQITRIAYERIRAYRRFVHAELTKAEYHQVLDFLTFHETHPSRSARPGTRPR